jgi:hypothetical protein
MFKKYRRKQIAELRPIKTEDIYSFKVAGSIQITENRDNPLTVSISDVDLANGSPKLGDMIAQNPKNNLDQWLVAKAYYEDNFEEI